MKKYLRCLLLVLCTLLVINPAVFASGEETTPVRLNGRTLWLPQNVAEFDTDQLPASQRFGRGYFVLVTFDQIPSEGERSQLKSFGIELLDYVPKRTYTAYLSSKALPQAAAPLGLTGIHAVPVAFKQSRKLYERDIPEHAREGKNLLLNVLLHSTVNAEEVLRTWHRKGIKVTSSATSSGMISVRISETALNDLLERPEVYYVETIDPEPQPENLLGVTSHRSGYISNGYLQSESYNGEGVWVAMGDDGQIGPHIDYTGRTDQSNAGASSGNHGDHIAGTIMGAGNLDPTTRGMAWGADLLVYNVWNAVNNSPTAHQSPGVMVTSTSYSNGCNAGYTNFARTADQQIRQNPNLMHVFSAGNSGTSDCGYGAGNQWGNVTGGVKIGKNVIAVGNLSFSDALANSSSRGPAHDGRIKPEICAMGSNVYSTNAGNIYAFSSGTSMSCPGISGSYAQLVHAYRSLNGGNDPESALIKGIMLNTADDLGNPGPDFRFGFGRVNARRALGILQNGTFVSGTLSQGGNQVHDINVPAGAAGLRIMICWTDYEAAPNAQYALVNDLDMQVNTPQAGTLLPWVLDPTPNTANLNANAVQAVDTLNNMEQVTVTNPAGGLYSVQVNGTSVPQGPQKYWLVYEVIPPAITVVHPAARENLVPGETETIRWDAFGGTGTFTIEFSDNGGQTWSNVASVPDFLRQYNWTVPSMVTGEGLIRITQGALTAESDSTFSIIGVPGNIHVPSSCPDSFLVAWTGVPGATEYEVSVLGQKYMDSATTSTTTEAYLYNYNPNVPLWISVKAKNGDAIGRRAIAVQKLPGTWNCLLTKDIALEQVLEPVGGPYLQCAAKDSIRPRYLIRNNGVQSMSGFTLHYRFNNGPVISETMNASIAPGDSMHYIFQSSFAMSGNGTFSFDAWIDAQDDNAFNDSLDAQLFSLGGMTVNLPVTEDFETFNSCNTANNCGQTSCSMSNGWFNLINGLMDDIDWRTDAGGTNSAGTGPSTDKNPGTAAGKYIYLEASGDCNFQTAELISPCIDLTNAVAPELGFSYHMFGSDMGELHVDVFHNGNWTLDVIPAIAGNRGNNWWDETVNLSPYTGGIVVVRFRGITGGDFRSDLALDDIRIQEATQAPQADFAASETQTCIGIPILLQDLSTNSPNQWTWLITPATHLFTGGTNANSFMPQVTFTDGGLYTITLSVSNPNGSDAVTKTSYVSVAGGAVLPLQEDFQSSFFPPVPDWSMVNPDGSFGWTQTPNITGINGTTTQSASIGFFNYPDVGEEDYLVMAPLDLTLVNQATLLFDVAYAQYDQTSRDGLRIDVSTDCGRTFLPTAYDRRGANLNTVGIVSSAFTPNAASQWRRDSLDLTQYVGSQITLRFVGINNNGNNLYLDNVNVQDRSQTVADMSLAPEICVGDTLRITNLSQGVNLGYTWDFGPGGSSASAAAGDQEVVYTTPGSKTVKLTVAGTFGTDSVTQQVNVAETPSISLSAAAIGLDITLNSNTQGDHQWDFGDQVTSNSGSPVTHQYAAGGTYAVELIVSNRCGADTSRTEVSVFPVSVAEQAGQGGAITAYPNPLLEQMTVTFDGVPGEYAIRLFDMQGKLVREQERVQITGVSSHENITWDVSGLARGSYLLKVTSNEQNVILPVVKQ